MSTLVTHYCYKNLNTYGSYRRAAISVGCNSISVRHWQKIIMLYCMTGGVQQEPLTGANQLLLSICIFTYPDVSSDQIAGFIHSQGGDIYTRSQIKDRCNELDLIRKRTSNESFDAFSETSLRSKVWFITLLLPLGVHTQPIHRFIDIDENVFCLKKCSYTYGRGHKTTRVWFPAHYRRNESKLNVILGVEIGKANIPAHLDGSIERPIKWFWLTVDNVDQFIFGNFINEILFDIERRPLPGNYNDHKFILLDNLRAHRTPFVTHIIEDRLSDNSFESVNRRPYTSKLAPIEYVFCELLAELGRRCERGWVMKDLRQEVIDVIQTLGRGRKLYSTFCHCGYPF